VTGFSAGCHLASLLFPILRQVMSIPKVVIVGRPNVGKSSLFNWLLGERISIVDPTAGVTRDRLSHLLEFDERIIELIDTGGMGVVDRDDLSDHIEHQIQLAVEAADVILLVVDTQEGVLPLDVEVAQRLRQIDVPTLCVANKADHDQLELLADDFLQFGWEVLPVSAKQKRGRIALMERIERMLPPPGKEEKEGETEPVMKLAIVGRRNTGKSTFINSLTQSDRVIASEIPGTTRDSIDVEFVMDDKPFIAIDTPGFLRRKSVNTDLEFYSTNRAERSIRRADVVLLFFDAGRRISKVDKQLCNYIEKQDRPCIFVVNKWDLMTEHMPTETWADYLRDTFGTMWHVPIAFITGLTGKNIKMLINHAQLLFKQSRSRVSTSLINQLVQAAMEYNPPPLFHHRKPKIYYASQVDIQPPTIILFCNNPDAFGPTYRRFLLGVMRDELPFGEVPIRLFFRKRQSDQLGAESGH
jgi:GTP-binding protein